MYPPHWWLFSVQMAPQPVLGKGEQAGVLARLLHHIQSSAVNTVFCASICCPSKTLSDMDAPSCYISHPVTGHGDKIRTLSTSCRCEGAPEYGVLCWYYEDCVMGRSSRCFTNANCSYFYTAVYLTISMVICSNLLYGYSGLSEPKSAHRVSILMTFNMASMWCAIP